MPHPQPDDAAVQSAAPQETLRLALRSLDESVKMLDLVRLRQPDVASDIKARLEEVRQQIAHLEREMPPFRPKR
jgi:hypothetical protein